MSPCRTAPGSVPENSRWNVLLITIDTLRADKVSCYGSKKVKTPHIDGLADMGVQFTRAFAHNPLTLPSHANILLGTTPPYHGVHDNLNFIIRDEFLTLPELLKENGYTTGAVIAAFPLDSRFGLAQGFDFYDDDFKKKGTPKNVPGERRAEAVVQIAQKWLEKQTAPWFLWLHIWDPHFPYQPPEPFLSEHKNKPYDGEVAYVDSVLGTFFQYLTDKDLMQGTAIVFTSDHGEALGDHGEYTHGMLAYNSTIWVPLIVTFPGARHARNSQVVSHVDIFPTICDIIGAEKPAFLQGRSLHPALEGKKLTVQPVYFESLEPYYNFAWAPLRGYLDQKHKFIDSPIFEYYNLETDFKESRNLAEDIIVAKYRAELNRIRMHLSHPDSAEAQTEYDYKTLEKLRSLGYVSSSPMRMKEKFTREDDIKILMPQLNQCFRAYSYVDTEESDKGIAQLQRMIQKKSRIYQPYLYLAKMLHAQVRTREALPVLEAGRRRFPENYELVECYARYLLEEGEYDRVIDTVTSRRFVGMEQDPVIWNVLGRAYYETGRLEDAIKTLEVAVSIDKEFADAYSNLGAALLALSMQTEAESMITKAFESLKQAVALDPDHEEAHFHLGLAYYHIGESAAAIHHLEQSLLLGWRNGKAYFYLGVAHLSLGNHGRAYRYFTEHKDDYILLLSPEEKQNLEQYIRRSQPKKKSPDHPCVSGSCPLASRSGLARE